VATSRLDPAQLLHVNVDQLPSHLPLIAANHSPGGSVQEVQSRQPPPAQYRVAGGSRMAGQGCQPVGTQLALTAQPADPRLRLGRQPPGAALWPRGPVTEPLSPLCLPSPQPPVHRLPRDPRRLGRRRHRPPFPLHPLDQQPPTVFRQPRSRSSISHEGPSTFWIQQPKTVVSGPSLCQQGLWELHGGFNGSLQEDR
jgi:hypothetical protein